MNKAILIPVYKHGKACVGVVESISGYCRENDTKILIVDDGNSEEDKAFLREIQTRFGDIVTVLVLEKNCGKGIAFKTDLTPTDSTMFHACRFFSRGQKKTKAQLFQAILNTMKAPRTTEKARTVLRIFGAKSLHGKMALWILFAAFASILLKARRLFMKSTKQIREWALTSKY